jgi:diguanylate cyclase (GGDEF)-like protein
VRPGSKLWIGAAAGLAFVQIVASALLPQGLALTAITDGVSGLLILALALAFARNALVSQGRLRSVWILQSLCWLFWLVDQCGWILYDVVLRKPLPEMFPGDVLLFLAGVPMLAGLLLRPHLLPSARSVRLGILDFLQLMLWWIYIYVYFVMCWQYIAEDSALYNVNYDRLYLLECLILLAVLGLLLKQSAGPWRRFYAYFLAAALLNCLTVAAENRAIEAKTYYSGSWYDILFAASFVLFMVVAITGRDLAPALETTTNRRYASWMSTLSVVAVLSLPVIVVVAIGDAWSPHPIVRFRVVLTAVTMFTLAILVFIKQRRLYEELKETNRTLEEASMTDPLTGIRNRRFFSTTVEGDIAHTLRSFAEQGDHSTRDLIFYLIDLDNFKEVNDLYGHDAGDRVLVETARRIGAILRESDVLLRWGGEEFLIVSRAADRRYADVLALRVMRAIREEPFAINPSTMLRRTCSIGWAAFPWLEDNVSAMGYEEVLTLADRALSEAKGAGKDQAVGMTPEQGKAAASLSAGSETARSAANALYHSNPAGLHFPA